MEYILNKANPLTTNNFGINAIKLDLDLPKDLKNFSYKISPYDKNLINVTLKANSELNSRIGLKADNYFELNITTVDNVRINKPLIIEYNLSEDLISCININVGTYTSLNVIIKCTNTDHAINYLKQVTNLKANSKANISIVNLFDNRVTNLVAMESNLEESSVLDYNYIDLGSNTKVSNYYSRLNGNNSINNFNNIYFGNNNNFLDMNYYIGCVGHNTVAKITSEGVLKDEARKNYKGTIDFISGCSGSDGEELENCVLLSKNAKSKSLPMLLCGEENVTGAHGVSTGKIDKERLFYLQAKGLNDKEATKLIVNGNFNKILNNIKDENILELINKSIESKL